jgi:hypothetical protein
LNQGPLLPKFRAKEGWTDGLLFGIVSKPRQIYLETKVTFELICTWGDTGEAKKKKIDPAMIDSMIFLSIFFSRNILSNLT